MFSLSVAYVNTVAAILKGQLKCPGVGLWRGRYRLH